MGFPARASEFPHDNAEISSGAIWVCAELTGAARAELQPFEPVKSEPFVFWFDDDEPHCEGPVEIELEPASGRVSVTIALESDAETRLETEAETEAGLEAETETGLEAETEMEAVAFAHFEGALVAALLSQGATRSAALLPRILRLESLPADSLAKNVELTLQSRGYLDGSARYSQKFRDLCSAWTAVLRGASQDFAACGTTTLDRFGAELLTALLAVPTTRADDLRRELRKAGVAAFGVLAAA